jgi:hypothetical protein
MPAFNLLSDRAAPKLVKVAIGVEARRKIPHLQANLAMLPDVPEKREKSDWAGCGGAFSVKETRFGG